MAASPPTPTASPAFRLSLRHYLALLAAVPILAILGLGALSKSNLERMATDVSEAIVQPMDDLVQNQIRPLLENELTPLITHDLETIARLEGSLLHLVKAQRELQAAVLQEKQAIHATSEEIPLLLERHEQAVGQAFKRLADAVASQPDATSQGGFERIQVAMEAWLPSTRKVFELAATPGKTHFARKASNGGTAEQAYAALNEEFRQTEERLAQRLSDLRAEVGRDKVAILAKEAALIKKIKEMEGAGASIGLRADDAVWNLAWGTGLAALVTLLFNWLFSGRISRPILANVNAAQALRVGDTHVRLQETGARELAQLSQAMNQLAVNLEAKASFAAAIAHGRLNASPETASDRDVLGRSLEDMTKRLGGMVAGIRETGQQVGAGASQIKDSSQTLSDGAARQAASVQEISTTLAALFSRVTETAGNASQADDFAQKTQAAAREGAQRLHALREVMEGLRGATEEISRITKLIDGLAFQTNLLALNASIEAAQAGRQGKGFGVVAREIRQLADRSAEAARDTERLIHAASERMTNGAAVTEALTQAMADIAARSSDTAAAMRQIAASTREQADGMGQINQGLVQIDAVTQATTAQAQEAAAAAVLLETEAKELLALLEWFKLRAETAEAALPPARAGA